MDSNTHADIFRNLDLTPEEFKRLGYKVIDELAEFYRSVDKWPVFPPYTPQEVADAVAEELPVEGQDPEGILDEWKSKVLPYASHMTSPRWFGFVNGSGTMIATLAETLAAALNQNAGGFKGAPAGIEIERLCIRWIAEAIGYHPDCGGLFVSGGTMADFTGLMTAFRNQITDCDTTYEGLQSKADQGKYTVYMADHEGHIAILRAVDMMNLGRNCVRRVPSKNDFTMDVDALRRTLEADLAEGHHPFCVVAQAGSINVGVVDPMEAIADLCEEYGLWMHVDGACGAVGAMLPEKNHLFRGMERADSITLDPHKWLYIPYECGCILVKDAEKQRRAFSMNAPYLRSSTTDEYNGLYYLDYGPQMSRGFRALKVWMSLKHYGLEGYRTLLSQNNACATYLDQLVRQSENFEPLHRPELFIYAFRFVPKRWRDKGALTSEEHELLDRLNQRIVDEIQLSGLAFIMTTIVRKRVVIRLSICSHRTTLHDMEVVLNKLEEIGVRIFADMNEI